MNKMLPILFLAVALCGCSKTEPVSPTPEKESKAQVSAQVKQILGSLSNIYKKTEGSQVYPLEGWYVSELKITPNQSIQVFVDQTGNLHHIFVKQRGEQEYDTARTDLIRTCRVVGSVIDAKLPPLVDQMDQKLKSYEDGGVSAQTVLSQEKYSLMIDISRYQVMDCLIATGDLKPIIGDFIEPPTLVRVTPQEAVEFAKTLYQKIDDDEKIIRKAFEAGQYQVLIQYEQHFLKFTDQPYSEREAAMKFGQRYFPQDPVAEPYFICDRALSELNSLASAMFNSTKTDIAYEDAAFYVRNLRNKNQLFKESKEMCRQRVNLSYEQAVEVYENSESI